MRALLLCLLKGHKARHPDINLLTAWPGGGRPGQQLDVCDRCGVLFCVRQRTNPDPNEPHVMTWADVDSRDPV